MICSTPNFSTSWSDSGALLGLTSDSETFVPALNRSFFEIDGFPAEARPDGTGFALTTSGTGNPALRSAPSRSAAGSDGHSAAVTIGPAETDQEELDITVTCTEKADSPVETVGLSLGLPVDSAIHLAEYYNTGRVLDADMPCGENYEGKLAYGFLVAHVGSMWIRFRVARAGMNGLTVRILRLPTMFAVTFRWKPGDPFRIRPFGSLEDATADFAAGLERDFGIRKLACDPNAPEWVRNTRLIFTIDMLRSNYEITHDFTDVEKLCGELRRVGCPEDTVMYIPGWQGAYDAAHPTYRPAEALGGEEAFRKMVDTAHRCGYRVMIHATGWGIDPYHPDIDTLAELAKREENGDYEGWQFGYVRRPEMMDLGYFTPALALPLGGGDARCTVKPPPAPANCEALFSVGGLQGCGKRLKLTCGPRSVTSTPGWFDTNDEFHYPFPLMLETGENKIEFALVDDPASSGDATDGVAKDPWYRIRYSFVPESPYTSWTWPILRADTENPEYHRVFVENVSGVVKDFGIDAVHVDASTLGWPAGVREMFYKLRDAMPGVPVNAELYTEFEGLGYWGFSQNATQSLVAGRRGPQEQQSLHMTCGLGEHYDWLDKPSPVCDFAHEYIRTYPHLCAVNAFVPVGKICNTFPARRMPVKTEEHWRVLRDAKRLGYIPSLRVNFREYGLDPETVAAITELTR